MHEELSFQISGLYRLIYLIFEDFRIGMCPQTCRQLKKMYVFSLLPWNALIEHDIQNQDGLADSLT
jgi:hypothetical protein